MAERILGGRVLAVRLDSDGDVLLTGPALRALGSGSDRLDLLAAPAGAQAAALLPGIDELLIFDPPWSGYRPTHFEAHAVTDLIEQLRARDYDHAVIFTSFHQSPLPMALLARMAGIGRVAATSEDYPGALLDVRHRRLPGGAPDDGGAAGGHEVAAALALVRAVGHDLPPGDDGRLRLRPQPFPRIDGPVLDRPYVVVHPCASVPSRSIPAGQARAIGDRLQRDGWHVVVTGGLGDLELAGAVVPNEGRSLIGDTTLAQLAGVLAGAACVVVGNTGPAHLAAAVGTPVVSLFSPVVPAERWAPWLVPHVLLGRQDAACRGSRARDCPVEGHPCLSGVSVDDVAAAVRSLARVPRARADSTLGGH